VTELESLREHLNHTAAERCSLLELFCQAGDGNRGSDQLLARGLVAARAFGEAADFGRHLPQGKRLRVCARQEPSSSPSESAWQCRRAWRDGRTNTPRAASYKTLHCGNDSSTPVSAITTQRQITQEAASFGSAAGDSRFTQGLELGHVDHLRRRRSAEWCASLRSCVRQ